MQLIHSMESILCEYHALPPQGKETSVSYKTSPRKGQGLFLDLPRCGTDVQTRCAKSFVDELQRLRGHVR